MCEMVKFRFTATRWSGRTFLVRFLAVVSLSAVIMYGGAALQRPILAPDYFKRALVWWPLTVPLFLYLHVASNVDFEVNRYWSDQYWRGLLVDTGLVIGGSTVGAIVYLRLWERMGGMPLLSFDNVLAYVTGLLIAFVCGSALFKIRNQQYFATNPWLTAPKTTLRLRR